jgi:hypothetical protein
MRRGGRAPRRGGSSARCGPPARAGPVPEPAAPCRRPSSAEASAPAPPPQPPRPPPPPPRRPRPSACSVPPAPHGARRRRRPRLGLGTAGGAAAMVSMCSSRQTSGWIEGRVRFSPALDCGVLAQLRWRQWQIAIARSAGRGGAPPLSPSVGRLGGPEGRGRG